MYVLSYDVIGVGQTSIIERLEYPWDQSVEVRYNDILVKFQ